MLSRRCDQSAMRATRRFQPKQTPVSPTLSPALRIATRGRGRKLGPVLYEGWLYFRRGQNPIVFPDGTARIAKTAGKGLSVSRDRFPSDSQKVPTRFPQGSRKVPYRAYRTIRQRNFPAFRRIVRYKQRKRFRKLIFFLLRIARYNETRGNFFVVSYDTRDTGPCGNLMGTVFQCWECGQTTVQCRTGDTPSPARDVPGRLADSSQSKPRFLQH